MNVKSHGVNVLRTSHIERKSSNIRLQSLVINEVGRETGGKQASESINSDTNPAIQIVECTRCSGITIDAEDRLVFESLLDTIGTDGGYKTDIMVNLMSQPAQRRNHTQTSNRCTEATQDMRDRMLARLNIAYCPKTGAFAFDISRLMES